MPLALDDLYAHAVWTTLSVSAGKYFVSVNDIQIKYKWRLCPSQHYFGHIVNNKNAKNANDVYVLLNIILAIYTFSVKGLIHVC